MEVHKLAIVVPYRDREEHLRVFLPHMKSYLDKQNVLHNIYIIEQEFGKPFNRAKLLNIGFLEADSDCDYFVFHDVDMLPQNVNYTLQHPQVSSTMGFHTRDTSVESRCSAGTHSTR
jgi:hypothetical protein